MHCRVRVTRSVEEVRRLLGLPDLLPLIELAVRAHERSVAGRVERAVRAGAASGPAPAADTSAAPSDGGSDRSG